MPALTSDLSSAFFQNVVAATARMGASGSTFRPLDLLGVLNSESGMKNIQNGAGAPCFGLNQLCLDTKDSQLKAVKFSGTRAQYAALDPADQVQYVENYFRSVSNPKNYKDVPSLYLANFLPGLLGGGTAPDRVLLRQGGTGLGGKEGTFYAENKGFDHTGKGSITVQDLTDAVSRAAQTARFKEAAARLVSEGGASVQPALPAPAVPCASDTDPACAPMFPVGDQSLPWYDTTVGRVSLGLGALALVGVGAHAALTDGRIRVPFLRGSW